MKRRVLHFALFWDPSPHKVFTTLTCARTCINFTSLGLGTNQCRGSTIHQYLCQFVLKTTAHKCRSSKNDKLLSDQYWTQVVCSPLGWVWILLNHTTIFSSLSRMAAARLAQITRTMHQYVFGSIFTLGSFQWYFSLECVKNLRFRAENYFRKIVP